MEGGLDLTYVEILEFITIDGVISLISERKIWL